MSEPKLGQIGHVGGVSKLSGPADSKTDPGFENRTRFEGVIGQNLLTQPQIGSNSTYRHGLPLYRILRARGRKWSMSWGTKKTPEVQKMTGNGGDHVLCTTVYNKN